MEIYLEVSNLRSYGLFLLYFILVDARNFVSVEFKIKNRVIRSVNGKGF